MARPKMDEKDKKIHTAFRFSKERLEQLDLLVIHKIEETDINSINRTTILDMLIKKEFERLQDAGEI